MAGGHTHRAASLLKELCSDNPPPHLARVLVHKWIWESLQQASVESRDEDLQESLKVGIPLSTLAQQQLLCDSCLIEFVRKVDS